MEQDQVQMFKELPIYQEDLERIKNKKQSVNCLQEIFAELMEKRKVSLAEVQKETKIPWGTLHGWMKGEVEAQKADRNLLALAQYFKVSLEYLVYGIGSDEPVFETFDGESA